MRYVQSLFVILSAICLGLVTYRAQQTELIAEQVRQDMGWAHRYAAASVAAAAGSHDAAVHAGRQSKSALEAARQALEAARRSGEAARHSGDAAQQAGASIDRLDGAVRHAEDGAQQAAASAQQAAQAAAASLLGPGIRRVPDALLAAVYRIQVDGIGDVSWRGSGVAVGPDLIMTAAHVADGAVKIFVGVRDENGVEAMVEAEVLVCLDQDAVDLAVLRVPGAKLAHVELAPAEEIRVGMPILSMGSPAGQSPLTCSLGWLAAAPPDAALWQGSCAIFFGNSGGPVFDANTGKLIGINVQGRGSPGAGIAANVNIFVAPHEVAKALAQARLAVTPVPPPTE